MACQLDAYAVVLTVLVVGKRSSCGVWPLYLSGAPTGRTASGVLYAGELTLEETWYAVMSSVGKGVSIEW